MYNTQDERKEDIRVCLLKLADICRRELIISRETESTSKPTDYYILVRWQLEQGAGFALRTHIHTR